jgi:hypothetical protein
MTRRFSPFSVPTSMYKLYFIFAPATFNFEGPGNEGVARGFGTLGISPFFWRGRSGSRRHVPFNFGQGAVLQPPRLDHGRAAVEHFESGLLARLSALKEDVRRHEDNPRGHEHCLRTSLPRRSPRPRPIMLLQS